MNTFYFNTGVRGYPTTKGQVYRNGVKQIPFDANAPANALLMFLCDNPNLPESEQPGVIVREVVNTTMISKYAYFRV